MTLKEIANNPQAIDLIFRETDFILNYLESLPEIQLSTIVDGRYRLAYVFEKDLDKVKQRLGSGFLNALSVVYGLLDREALEASGILQVQEQPFLDLRGNGTLLGFVDTGIDYTQDVFRYKDGTSRIVSIFDQTIKGDTPYNFLIGTEYTQEQINEALKAEDPFEIVPHTDDVGHGTFLASVSAGSETGGFIGAAPNAELIVVKLEKARPYYLKKYLVPPEQENVFEGSSIMVGVEYILKKARELNKPVSICIGLGTNMGGHDGFSQLEEYLDEVARTSGVCICTAAGNESQARHHTQGFLLATGDSQDIDIIIEGQTTKSVYVSVLSTSSDKISVSIRSPSGELVGRIPAKSGTTFETKLIFEKARISVQYYFPLEGSSGQVTIIKLIDATPGVWKITVYGDIVLDGSYHAYLPMTGMGPPGVEFLTPNPNFTIVSPATSFGTISCGAYDSSNNRLFFQSSWGPTLLPTIAPDLVAPGANVGGVFPTGFGTLSGTSVAAAITAGACALLLQWGVVEGNELAMSTFQIRGLLIRGCIRQSNIIYPNPQWGYGILNLINTFNMMRETRLGI